MKTIHLIPWCIIGTSIFFSFLFLIASTVPREIYVVIIREYVEMSPPVFVKLAPEPELAPAKIAKVTAYSEYDSCHYENCLMANGIPAQTGFIACPRALPFGTQVDIDGTVYTCGDRTAVRYDGRFDIFVGYGENAYREAIRFGIQEMSIRVLSK